MARKQAEMSRKRRSRSRSRSRSRKHHKHAGHKTHRRYSRKQKGGSSCAYMPTMNRQMAQIGGMASMESAYGTLLDGKTAIQAQVGPLNAAFAELPSVIPKQQGGRRHKRYSRKHRRYSHHGGMHPFDSAFAPVTQQPAGASAQFMTESDVNKSFGNFGPQH